MPATISENRKRCCPVHFVLAMMGVQNLFLTIGVCIPSEAFLDKISFSLASSYQLKLVSGLGVGTCVHFSDLAPHLLETHAIPLDAATVPEFMPISILLCLGCFVSLMRSFPSDSQNHSASCTTKFSGEGSDGGILFRTECSKVSHSLHMIQLCVSVFVLMGCRRKCL